jgi:hypothetical protein
MHPVNDPDDDMALDFQKLLSATMVRPFGTLVHNQRLQITKFVRSLVEPRR